VAKTLLKIGDLNTVREFVTINRGTPKGGGQTVVGSDNLLMFYFHVVHDCLQVILANGATLAGHVTVDDYAILGGLCAVHQFARIGSHVMISGGSMATQDVPPYTIAQGDGAKTVGINQVGLKRCGFSHKAVRDIKQAYKLVFRSAVRNEEALEKIEPELTGCMELETFITFIRNSSRGIAR
jgi:UDP-N-acetylglucosamine acyltransferase